MIEGQEGGHNGGENGEGLADVDVLAGVVARVDSALIRAENDLRVLKKDLSELRQTGIGFGEMLLHVNRVLSDHTETLARIAKALGIEPMKSVPPIRKELESLHEIDNEVRGRLAGVEKDVAETRTIVKVGMIEHMPKIAKGVGAIAVGIAVLTGLVQFISNLVAGQLKP